RKAALGGTVQSDRGIDGTLIVDSEAFTEGGVDNALHEFDAQFSSVFGYEVASKNGSATIERRATPAGEATIGQPVLLRGRGALKRKIPMLISPNNDDLSLLQFEGTVRNLVKSVEDAYWDLYTGYRSFEAAKEAQASALNLWRVAKASTALGDTPPEAETQARALYYQFTAQLRSSLYGSKVPGNDPLGLYGRELVLREKLGWSSANGKLIRATTDPSVVRVVYEWDEIREEALARNFEIRQHQWAIEQRALELQSAKSQILPQLESDSDARWLDGSSALELLTGGKYREYALSYTPQGVGRRRALANIQNAELEIKKFNIELEEKEVYLLHELSRIHREVDTGYKQMKDYLDQWIANEDEVRIYNERIKDDAGELGQLLDTVLRAEERRSRAEQLYYQAVCEYNKTIVDLHYLKGSLLDYNNISLVEDSEGKSTRSTPTNE
ncbi:MAG: TolC family protein, partial [Pirellulaceae bacterium]